MMGSAPAIRGRKTRWWLYLAVECVLLVVGLFVVLPWVLGIVGVPLISKELVYSSRSPSGTWQARAYYRNPGAMASAWYDVELTRTSDGSTREIWTGPELPEAPSWLNDSTLLVGEQRVSATGPEVTWRDAPVGGLPDPQQAVREYISALAADDLAAAQHASRLIVTKGMLPQLRREAFGSPRTLKIIGISLARDPSITAWDQGQFIVTITIVGKGGVERTVRLHAVAIKERGRWHAEGAWR